MEVTHRGHRPTVKETEEISMIGAIMILAVVAYLVWTFWGRAFHVIGQYKKGGSQFKLSEPLDYEAIYQKLKEGLQYPDNRNLFYDEFGQPSIAGRYGTYTNVLSSVYPQDFRACGTSQSVSAVQAHETCTAQQLNNQRSADYRCSGIFYGCAVSGTGRYGKGA